MINTLSKMGGEGGWSTSISIMSLNILFVLFGRHPLVNTLLTDLSIFILAHCAPLTGDMVKEMPENCKLVTTNNTAIQPLTGIYCDNESSISINPNQIKDLKTLI